MSDDQPDYWYPKDKAATQCIKNIEEFFYANSKPQDPVAFAARASLSFLTGFVKGMEERTGLVPRGTNAEHATDALKYLTGHLEAPPRPPEILIQVKGSLGAITLESLREMLEDKTTHSRFHNIGGISPKKRAEYLRWAVERYAKARAEREAAAKKKKNVPRGTKKRGTK